MHTIRMLCLLAAAALLLSAAAGDARSQSSTAALVGNVERGKTAYSTYKCYACHGTRGETGSPRLVPMARTQENFIAFVRKPAQAMPPFADVQEQTLADVYAFIKSIPATPPPAAESIPILNEILKTLK